MKTKMLSIKLILLVISFLCLQSYVYAGRSLKEVPIVLNDFMAPSSPTQNNMLLEEDIDNILNGDRFHLDLVDKYLKDNEIIPKIVPEVISHRQLIEFNGNYGGYYNNHGNYGGNYGGYGGYGHY
jgi:hypothetical protein